MPEALRVDGWSIVTGTADPAHLQANVATGTITLHDATLAELAAIPSRSAELPLG